jgi:hypothetical protein
VDIPLSTSSCPGIKTVCLWSPPCGLRFDVEYHAPLIINNFDSVLVLNHGPHLSMCIIFQMDFECKANDRTCMYSSFSYNVTVSIVARQLCILGCRCLGTLLLKWAGRKKCLSLRPSHESGGSVRSMHIQLRILYRKKRVPKRRGWLRSQLDAQKV